MASNMLVPYQPATRAGSSTTVINVEEYATRALQFLAFRYSDVRTFITARLFITPLFVL